MSFFSKIKRSLDLLALFYYTCMCGISGSTSNSLHLTQIACRVCQRVFTDNVSLCLHFEESHRVEEIPDLNQPDGTLASSQSETMFTVDFSLSTHSSVNTSSVSRHVDLPNNLTPYSHSVSSDNPPNLSRGDVNLVDKPMVSSTPTIGANSHARGLATVLPVPSNEANRGQQTTLVNKKPQGRKSEFSSKEMIIISDDEEDAIDLTLRL